MVGVLVFVCLGFLVLVGASVCSVGLCLSGFWKMGVVWVFGYLGFLVWGFD